MSSDLVSLRLLVVSTSRPLRDLLRQGSAMAPIPIEMIEAEDAAAVSDVLGRGAIDIAFLDCAIAAPIRAAICTAAKSCGSPPFVMLVAGSRDEATSLEATSLAADAVDGIAVKPATPAEATDFVERCIHVRLPSRVLLVDDSATMRSIVRKILGASRFQMQIAEASEGIAALKQIASGTFDVVILDYNMPGLNGIETLSEIKRQCPRVGVVMITSTPDEAIAERARKAGAAAFLRKPFYPSDIDAVLCSVFALRLPGGQ